MGTGGEAFFTGEESGAKLYPLWTLKGKFDETIGEGITVRIWWVVSSTGGSRGLKKLQEGMEDWLNNNFRVVQKRFFLYDKDWRTKKKYLPGLDIMEYRIKVFLYE